MEIKKYIILLILTYLLSNDINNYKVSLYGIPMSSVTINYKDTIYHNKESINLKFETQTNEFASKIFKVDNLYETIIAKDNFEILSFQKITHQPGLINKLITINKNDSLFYINSDITIPKNYFNIFSLLHYLTITPFAKIESNINLEREGLLYNCHINKIDNNDVYEYELIFNPINNTQKSIIEHTDMFTWAIFKKNSYKKISVYKNDNKIKTCVFHFGLTKLEAEIE